MRKAIRDKIDELGQQCADRFNQSGVEYTCAAAYFSVVDADYCLRLVAPFRNIRPRAVQNKGLAIVQAQWAANQCD